MPYTIIMILGYILGPLVIYLFFNLKKSHDTIPLPGESALGLLRFELRIQYWMVSAAAIILGVELALHFWSSVLVLVIATFLGLLPSKMWTEIRVKRSQLRRGGPDDSVPEESLFPSDIAARKLQQCDSPKLPFWYDFLMLLGCEIIGLALGMVAGLA